MGSPDSIYLNFAIALLTTAISLTIVLVTTPITSITLFAVFLVCLVLGYVGGLLLLLLWRRNRNSVADCMKVIRKRLPPGGVAENIRTTQDGQ